MWCMNSANLKVFFGTLVKSKPGKDGKVRQVRLPEVASRSVLSLRGDAGISDPYSAAGNAVISPSVPSMAWSNGPPRLQSVTRRTACVMRMGRMRSTAALC